MTETTIDDPLTLDQTKEAITQLLENAKQTGQGGMDEASLFAAVDALRNLCIDAGAWSLWAKGQIRIGWNPDTKDLIFRTDS